MSLIIHACTSSPSAVKKESFDLCRSSFPYPAQKTHKPSLQLPPPSLLNISIVDEINTSGFSTIILECCTASGGVRRGGDPAFESLGDPNSVDSPVICASSGTTLFVHRIPKPIMHTTKFRPPPGPIDDVDIVSSSSNGSTLSITVSFHRIPGSTDTSP
jgi:hypothetical protein